MSFSGKCLSHLQHPARHAHRIPADAQPGHRAPGHLRLQHDPARPYQNADVAFCKPAPYVKRVIRSFRSRALKRFFERDDGSRLPPADLERIAIILDRRDAAMTPSDMDLPGLRFHALAGRMKGRYAVTVRANWRITFAWDEADGDAIEVDYEDYH